MKESFAERYHEGHMLVHSLMDVHSNTNDTELFCDRQTVVDVCPVCKTTCAVVSLSRLTPHICVQVLRCPSRAYHIRNVSKLPKSCPMTPPPPCSFGVQHLKNRVLVFPVIQRLMRHCNSNKERSLG